LKQAHQELERKASDLAEANAQLRAQIDEREKAEEALRQAQKMETIGQLTGGVAHDFNNLLTIILGNLERMQRHLESDGDTAPLRAMASNAIQGAKRAATLTRSLLAFSRRQPLDPRPVDVNRLVATMSEMLRRTLGEQITIESVVAGGLWRTFVDLNQLENAILNLAVNARDAMPAGGKLTIETANAHLDARYAAAHPEVAPGQYVVLSITDTGAGMSKVVIEKAFEPFFTTKDVGHGTGLGLSQVYGFVKQSGGHIKIYSEIGQGTTVKIYLPRLLAEEEPERAETPDAPAAADPSETILVVEDDDGVREHSVTLLKDLGYRVLEAATGAAALELLDRHPDVVLLFSDVGLPGGMNGRQLADEARRRRPELRVLFTTGYARNAIVHDGRLDPGVHLVTKPFSSAELAQAVRELLDRRDGPQRILVVEDEFLVRMATVQALEELGFLVEEAGTATEAITKARHADGRIDAALIDLGLPDRKGDLLAAELRALHKHMPLVIATGYAQEVVRERFASDPLVGFLGKPFETREIAAVLQALRIRMPDEGSEDEPAM
jgi:signal transduction histidine kinase/CheY-like chemotaxis protein